MSAKKAKPLNKKSKTAKPMKKFATPAKKAKIAKKVVKKIVKKTIKKAIKKPAKAVKKVAAKIIKKITKKPAAKINKKNIPVKKTAKAVKKVAAKIENKIVTKKVAKPVKAIKLPKEKKQKPVKQTAPKIEKTKAVDKKITEIVIPKTASKSSKSSEFKIGEYAVYPSHGIGKIIDIQKTTVLGSDFSCYLMHFEKEKLTIKVPIKNSEKIGLRSLVSKSQMDEVFSILRSGIKKLKGMWSRRAQEYESKINSGNIILLAEVLRDLTRDIEDGERSYSERIIYETAISRLACEYAAIYKIDFEEAKGKVVVTAKDKLGSDEKVEKPKRDDDFDYDDKEEVADDSEEGEIDDEDEEGEEDDSYGDDDDDDDKPRKKRKK